MSENTTISEAKSFFTVNKLLKLLSVFCIAFVFCPVFLVSCSGEDLEVSVMTAVKGVSAYGENVTEPRPVMLVCLILPILILAVLSYKKFSDKKASLITMGCAIADTFVWMIFKTAVKELAEENYCDFKVTGWYYLNIISLLMIIVIPFLITINKLNMEMDLRGGFTNVEVKSALEQMSTSVGQKSECVTQIASGVVSTLKEKGAKEDVIGYCSKCGKPIQYGSKFCMACGTAVPEGLLAEAEAAKKAEQESLTAETMNKDDAVEQE